MAKLMSVRAQSDGEFEVAHYLVVEITPKLVELLERVQVWMPWDMFPEMNYVELVGDVHPTDLSPMNIGDCEEDAMMEYKEVSGKLEYIPFASIYFNGDLNNYPEPPEYDFATPRVRVTSADKLTFFVNIVSDFDTIETYACMGTVTAFLKEAKKQLEEK